MMMSALTQLGCTAGICVECDKEKTERKNNGGCENTKKILW